MKTAIVSNVPWGYGTPQVRFLKESIEQNFGIECLVFCPTYDTRPIISQPGVSSIVTKEPMTTIIGKSEYVKVVARQLNSVRPEHIVIINPEMLLTLSDLKYSPQLLTYYGLEPIDTIHMNISLLKKERRMIDIAVFPELNRLKKDVSKFENLKVVFEVFNTQINQSEIGSVKENDLIYAGTLDPGWIDFEYLRIIDKKYLLRVFGDASELPRNLSSELKNFNGLLNDDAIRSHIEKSKFSIVCWKTNNFGLFNAAPNKLFQSLSCNTPVISFPYPQVVKLAETLDGIYVAEDFTTESLIEITDKASQVNESIYTSIQQDINKSFQEKLLWDVQINPYLQYVKRSYYE